MPQNLVLQHPNLPNCTLDGITEQRAVSNVLRVNVADDFVLNSTQQQLLAEQQIDAAVLPEMRFADLGLIVSDMDSTLITIECIDEIAAGAGLKAQVAEITEQSMRGELDFEQSLRRRVSLLAGLHEGVLQEVYDNVLQLSPGAEYLLEECKRHNVKFMLVSGGFTFFTDRLKARLGLDYAYANTLESENGILTGRLKNRIIDAQAKADLLEQHRRELGLQTAQVLAMGDGANDIPMLQAAGIGVAYHAKPKTKQFADICIDFGGLDAVRRCFL
ncbi:MAG: phosphoserine phosphatase SerB [Neisseria sp.]|nr:phosphoserine phosphatase SerB [Neisseria sp.]